MKAINIVYQFEAKQDFSLKVAKSKTIDDKVVLTKETATAHVKKGDVFEFSPVFGARFNGVGGWVHNSTLIFDIVHAKAEVIRSEEKPLSDVEIEKTWRYSPKLPIAIAVGVGVGIIIALARYYYVKSNTKKHGKQQ